MCSVDNDLFNLILCGNLQVMMYYNEIFLHSSALINGNRHDNVIKKFGNVLDLLFLPYTKKTELFDLKGWY